MSTYAIRQRLVEIAKGEVGVREEPKDSNTGSRIREYQRATTLDGTGWPWCAAFVCWCVREWLKDQDVLDAFKFTKEQAEAWRPKTAGAYAFHAWAFAHNLPQMDDSASHILHTGDLVTYDISHIGIVDTDKDQFIFTIEGNTDPTGGREGGGVYELTRRRSFARRFIRMLP